jgi:hypothetical protein
MRESRYEVLGGCLLRRVQSEPTLIYAYLCRGSRSLMQGFGGELRAAPCGPKTRPWHSGNAVSIAFSFALGEFLLSSARTPARETCRPDSCFAFRGSHVSSTENVLHRTVPQSIGPVLRTAHWSNCPSVARSRRHVSASSGSIRATSVPPPLYRMRRKISKPTLLAQAAITFPRCS